MSYTIAQLEEIWVQAGGDVTKAPIAAAISYAESAGNPQAVCYDYTDSAGVVRCSATPRADSTQFDAGLWQVASVHGYTTPDQLFDPIANAKAAIAISGNGQNWNAWSTFTNGAYKQFVNDTNVGGFLGWPGLAGGTVRTPIPGGADAPAKGAVQSFPAGSQSGVNATTKAATTGFFGPLIDAANTIAFEGGALAIAIALIALGAAWLAAPDVVQTVKQNPEVLA